MTSRMTSTPMQKPIQPKFVLSPKMKARQEILEQERCLIAMRMLRHNEPDEKISLYTGFSIEVTRKIRGYYNEMIANEAEEKRRAMVFRF